LNAPSIIGCQLLSVDDKRRITIGADFRRQLEPEITGGALVIVPNDPGVLMFPEKYFKEMMNSQVPPKAAPSREIAEYIEAQFSLGIPVKLDAQWRITLPDEVTADGGLKGELALVGNQDHLKLIPRKVWDERRAYLLKNRAVILERAAAALKEMNQQPPAIHITAGQGVKTE
jgi:DNA-binding transcriptional regulator/RsmH inhibitor MraZ